MSAISTRLLNVAIIHNELACEDESATDVEATEKILYYYPESDDSRARLNHLSLCEGLIAFSRTMNPHAPIETVHMQNRRFVFEEVEPSVWCIAVFADDKSNCGMLDDASAHSVVQQVYEALSLFVGPLRAIFNAPMGLAGDTSDVDTSKSNPSSAIDSLAGESLSGLAFVLRLQAMRKKLRKLQALPEDHYRDMTLAEAQAAQARDVATSSELEAGIARMVVASPAEALRRQLAGLLGRTLLPSLTPLLGAGVSPFGADLAGFPLLAVEGSTFLAAREVATTLGFGDALLLRRRIVDEAAVVNGESDGDSEVASSQPTSGALLGSGTQPPEVAGVCVLVDGQVLFSDFPHAHAKLLLRNHLKQCYEPALRAQAAATSAAAVNASTKAAAASANGKVDTNSSSNSNNRRSDGASSNSSSRPASSRWSTAAIGSALRATVSSSSSRASEAQPSSPLSPKGSDGGAAKGLSPSAGGYDVTKNRGGFLSGGQTLVEFGSDMQSSANNSSTGVGDNESGPWIAVGGGRRIWAPRVFVPCKSAPSPSSAPGQGGNSNKVESKALETTPVWAATGQKTLWRSVGRTEFNRRVAAAAERAEETTGALVEMKGGNTSEEGSGEVQDEEEESDSDDDDWLASDVLESDSVSDQAALAPGSYMGRALCYTQGRCALLLLADPAIDARCRGQSNALPVEIASWGAGVTRAVAPALNKLNHLLGERPREVPVLEGMRFVYFNGSTLSVMAIGSSQDARTTRLSMAQSGSSSSSRSNSSSGGVSTVGATNLSAQASSSWPDALANLDSCLSVRARVAVADAHAALNAHRTTLEASNTSAARLVMLKLGAPRKSANKSTPGTDNSSSTGETAPAGGSESAAGNSNGEGRSGAGGAKAVGKTISVGGASSGEEWVIGERFGERELFVFLDQRCRTPGDALDELAKLKGGLLSSIVLP